MNFEDRYLRLDQILSKVPKIKTRHPLYREVPVSDPLILKLYTHIVSYLYVSLLANGQFILFSRLFENPDYYRQEILELPNKTPNGLVLPKKENFAIYNMVHSTVREILEELHLHESVSLIHTPINIRCVSGQPNREIDQRPHASTKLHSDVWTGEFTNTTMVFIPVLGDMQNIGIEFFEPDAEEFKNFTRILGSYDEGAGLIKNSKRYDCEMQNGSLYLTDPYLLHRTVKRKPGIRISIDFRFISKYPSVSDVAIQSKREINYVDYEKWSQTLLVSSQNLKEYTEMGPNQYASRYELYPTR